MVLTGLGAAASPPLFLLLAFHSALLFTVATIVLEIGGARREELREVPSIVSVATLSAALTWLDAAGRSRPSVAPWRARALSVCRPPDGWLEMITA